MKQGQMCAQKSGEILGDEAFKKFYPMDLIGFCSNLGYFQQVINLGSWKDGYVSVHSELLEVQQKWQNFAIMAFEGLKIQRFLLAHDGRRFANSPKLD